MKFDFSQITGIASVERPFPLGPRKRGQFSAGMNEEKLMAKRRIPKRVRMEGSGSVKLCQGTMIALAPWRERRMMGG